MASFFSKLASSIQRAVEKVRSSVPSTASLGDLLQTITFTKPGGVVRTARDFLFGTTPKENIQPPVGSEVFHTGPDYKIRDFHRDVNRGLQAITGSGSLGPVIEAIHQFRVENFGPNGIPDGGSLTPDISNRLLKTLKQETRKRLIGLATELKNKNIDADAFKASFSAEIKNLHIAASILGAGGVLNLSPLHIEQVTSQIQQQLDYLDGYVLDLQKNLSTATGLTQRDVSRAGQYADAANVTASQSRRQFYKNETQGQGEERRILGAAEHCPDAVIPGQLVKTRNGKLPIELVTPGDFVLTRVGYALVTQKITKKNIRTVNCIGFRNNQAQILLTHNHHLWTVRGWISANMVIPGDVIYFCSGVDKFREESVSSNTANYKAHQNFTTWLKGLKCLLQNRNINKKKILYTFLYSLFVEYSSTKPVYVLSGMTEPFDKEEFESYEHPAIRELFDDKQTISDAHCGLGFDYRLVQHFRNFWLYLSGEINEYVINLEVRGYPEFILNRILVHNCVDYALSGWQPIGTLPPIGDSQCGQNCECRFEFREVRDADSEDVSSDDDTVEDLIDVGQV